MAPDHSAPSKHARLQNYLLAWLDATIDESSTDCQHSLQQLRTVITEVTLFTESDACIQYLQSVKDEKVFVIASGSLGKDFLPRVHSMVQVNTIFIFCRDRVRHKPWSNQWFKIGDVYTRIEPICEALRQSTKRCNQDHTPMSFLLRTARGSTPSLNQLEPSFMYTHLFKNAILDMKHERQARDDFVKYCRERRTNIPSDLKLIEEFERDYSADKAIWWYTRECFMYQMLNQALRLLEADNIVNMAFFVHDLHRQIEQLHRKQVGQYGGKTFT